MKSRTAKRKALVKLGLRLRQIRTERGWTLEDTEQYGWQSWQHLQKVEAGKNVTFLTLVKISHLYEITLEELFEDLEF